MHISVMQHRIKLRGAFLALLYFGCVTASLHLTRFDGGIAVVWAAGPLLIAMLCASPRRYWIWYAFLCLPGGILASELFGIGGVGGFALACFSVVEAFATAWVMKRWYPRFGRFQSLNEVTRFIVMSGLIVPAVAAAIGAWCAHLAVGVHYGSAYRDWYAGHALGNLVFAPPLLLVIRGDLRRKWRSVQRLGANWALLLLALVAATSVAAFVQSQVPIVLLPVLVMLAATFRLGRFGAVTSILLLVGIGLTCSLVGLGPTTLLPGGMNLKLQVLQIYFATVVLILLPIAGELKARHRALLRLRETEQLHLLVLDQTSDVVLRIGAAGTIRYASRSVERVWGYQPEAVVGQPAGHLVHPDDLDHARQIRRHVMAQPERTGAVEYRINRKDGGTIWVESHIRATVDDQGEVTGTVSVIREITERRQATEALVVRAATDPLTGLANRRAFNDALAHELAMISTAEPTSCVAVFDLDHFKAINDRHGHAAGDEVLVRFASILRNVVRDRDLVARIGGEEFAVLLVHTTIGQAHAVSERARGQLENSGGNADAGTAVHATASAGIAVLRDSMASVMATADAALYRAKHDGRNRVALAP
jgi:diguanylate cyclase (GGDEF)-like protein/PAS domain S-box-containing protein